MESLDLQKNSIVMFKVLVNVNSATLPTIGKHEGYISGVGRSTQNLIKAFAKINDPEIQVETCLESHRYFGKYTQSYGLNHHWTILPYRYSKLFRRCLNYDLYHYPNNYFASNYPHESFLITIHDTIQYENIVKVGDVKKIKQIKGNVRNCHGIVTCSEYSKRRIQELFRVNPDKIAVIPWGIDMQMFRVKQSFAIRKTLSMLRIHSPYFLAVSCRDSRKNIPVLLKAFQKYTQSHNSSLVLIWGNPPLSILREYEHEIRNERLCIIDYVTDEQLVDLYNGAECTLFPSRQEGFGFPILESFACGTPVMTCRNSSLVEVGGAFANYVGEDDIDGMVDVMIQMDSSDKLSFQKTIKKYISGFSWEETGRRYLDVYKKIIISRKI